MSAIFKFTMRLITTRNFTILVIILISAWLASWILRNHYTLGLEESFESIPDNVDLTLKGIKYTKTRGGKPLWSLVADSAAQSKEDGSIRIKNVRMVIFDQELGDIELTAGEGELKPEDRTVTVSSSVLVTNSSGNSLQTEHLEYEESTNILKTDRMVKIDFDHFILSGKGMQVDVTERTLVLLGNVNAEFHDTTTP